MTTRKRYASVCAVFKLSELLESNVLPFISLVLCIDQSWKKDQYIFRNPTLMIIKDGLWRMG